MLDDGTRRRFSCTPRSIELAHDTLALAASGDQGRDGDINRYDCIDFDGPVSAEELRQIGMAALALADDMDRHASVDAQAVRAR